MRDDYHRWLCQSRRGKTQSSDKYSEFSSTSGSNTLRVRADEKFHPPDPPSECGAALPYSFYFETGHNVPPLGPFRNNQTKPESKPGTCHPVFRSHANQSPIMTASSNEVQVGVFYISPVVLYEYLRTYVSVK